MLLSALRRRSFPAWVGIFAILTIFVAPVISQTQVHNEREHGTYESGQHDDECHSDESHKNSTTTLASQRDTIAEHHDSGHTLSGHHTTQSHPSPSSPTMMMDHAACGYCVLFSYTPALFTTGSATPILITYLSEALVIHIISRIVLPARYASPVVRAPPF